MSNIVDIKPKAAKVVLNGTERNLKFDLNAFAELEEIYGSIDAAMQAMEKGSIKSIRTLIWAGLIHEDEKLTEKQVGSWIALRDLEPMTIALKNAMETALPQAKEAGKSPN